MASRDVRPSRITRSRIALGAGLLGLSTLVSAQAQSEGKPQTTGTPAPATNEPAVVRTVIEDEGARIEELRVRGEVQRITVRSKTGGVVYEVLPASGARDPSQGMAGTGQTAGRRVWNLLSF